MMAPARKALLRESRLSITRALVTAVREAAAPPSVFISGSAIGYYGSDPNATFDESSPAGRDFLAQLCADWGGAAREAESGSCRVVLCRTGLVLARDGGVLAKLRPPFMFFAGGPTGTGRHWIAGSIATTGSRWCAGPSPPNRSAGRSTRSRRTRR
jgi:hypothetical protein